MLVSAINEELILLNIQKDELFRCGMLSSMMDVHRIFDTIVRGVLDQVISSMRERIKDSKSVFVPDGITIESDGCVRFNTSSSVKIDNSSLAIMIATQKYTEFIHEIARNTNSGAAFCLEPDFEFDNSIEEDQVMIIADLIENKTELELTSALEDGMLNYFRSKKTEVNSESEEDFFTCGDDSSTEDTSFEPWLNANQNCKKPDNSSVIDKGRYNNKSNTKKTKVLDLHKHDVQQYLKPSASSLAILNREDVDVKVTNFSLGINFSDWDVASGIIKCIDNRGTAEVYRNRGNKYIIAHFPDMSLLSAIQICNSLIEYDKSKWLTSLQIKKIEESGEKILNNDSAQEMCSFV